MRTNSFPGLKPISRAFMATLLLALALLPAGAAVEDERRRAVERAIARLSEISGGTVGVSAVHVETGRRVSVNGGARFPMASVYKLPIALQLLSRVERGEVRLDDAVSLTARDFRGGHSPLARMTGGGAVTLTAGRLLELMLGESDNTASDAILRLAGGPSAVTKRMRELGAGDVDVSRSEAYLGAALSGVYELPPESEWSPQLFERLSARVAPADRKAAAEKFLADPRDTATPDALADLLVRVHRGEALSAPGTERLLRIMEATTTGPARLKGLLPPGTVVAHKTGTWGIVGTTNDVGLITLPDGAGHVALAVLVKASTKETADSERAIAEIARTVYDFFLFK